MSKADTKHTEEKEASERRRNRRAAKAQRECHSLNHFVQTDQVELSDTHGPKQ